MKKLYFKVLLLALWQIAAMLVDRSVILPYPIDVLKTMVGLFMTPLFYQSLFYTMMRIILSLALSFILGMTLAYLSYQFEPIHMHIAPLISYIQTIPQISYIIILLVWLKSTTALFVIIIIMLLPIIYNNIYHGLLGISDELKDVILLYHHDTFYNIRHVYLPLLIHSIDASMDACIPLSIKVAVMSEIFVSSSLGIGKMLYIARINIDMSAIFALTLSMIIIIQGLLKLYHIYIHKRNTKRGL